MRSDANGESEPLGLGELVDLELQFLEDRSQDARTLRERDEAIARSAFPDGLPESRHALFRGWLRELNAEHDTTPGRKLQASYGLLSFGLILFGALAGAGAAGGILRYDGSEPVNVITYLAVFVGAQIVTVLLTLFSMTPARYRSGVSPFGLFGGLLREFGVRRAGVGTLAGAVGGEQALGKLKSVGALYGPVERWRLLTLTQRSAVAFNVAALAVSLYRVTVTALAFSWSTTLDVEPGSMTAICRAIAAPWSWFPDAVPTAELVERSRTFPGMAHDPTVLTGWWQFLVAALATYGLLPRLALWLYSERKVAGLLRGLRLDHAEARLAYDRLAGARTRWHSDGRDEGSEPSSEERPAAGSLPQAGVCEAVVWADAPVTEAEAAAVVSARLGWTINALHADLAAVPPGAAEVPLVFLAESWEAPTKAVCRTLAMLREGQPAGRSIVVCLLGDGADRAASASELEVWRRRVGELGDPYLHVDAGGEGA